MAKQQQYVRPDDFEARLVPWIEQMRKKSDWGNAREMRTLLEKAREAHAVRSSKDPTADVSKLEISDLLAGIDQNQ
jgi:hypothetical protein